MKLLKILLFFAFIILTFWLWTPDWKLSIFKEKNNVSYTLSYSPWDYNHPLDSKPLSYCLAQIDKDFSIRIMLPLKDCKVQDEIRRYFQKNATKALDRALKYSGNMHNPVLEPLIKKFPLAFRSTSLYKDLDKALKSRGYIVEEEISFEKFSIYKSMKPYVLHADIWLHAKRISD